MRNIALVISLAALLPGCASVSFNQLNADLTAKSAAPKGAIYYMPKPYLLVTQLPFTPVASSTPQQAPDPTPPKKDSPKPKPGGADDFPQTFGGPSASGGADDKPAAAGDSPALASGSDQSFAGSSEGYLLKIVYLPDMTRPMAVSVEPGFGTASLKPTLQNGWMLTGFDASADSKAAELLTALAPLVTAIKTPGKAASGDTKGGSGPEANASAAPRPILRPGLYAFDYDSQGRLTGLCAVTYFDTLGVTQAAGTGACSK